MSQIWGLVVLRELHLELPIVKGGARHRLDHVVCALLGHLDEGVLVSDPYATDFLALQARSVSQ